MDLEYKHPDYSKFFLGDDKYEKFNRKMFNFNLKANKYIVKNIHILWATIFPKFIIDSLNNAYINIEYPKRLVSCLLQKDMEGIKHETKRFLINTIIGAGGLYDAALKFFKLEMYDEDMEQAFAKCKLKCGAYLVMPFISSTTNRDIMGRIFDFLLTPSTYIATPIAAAIKMGLLINRTTKIQPMIKMVESNFIDPYDIAKKFFGVEKYIKLSNYDRKKVIENLKDDYDETDLVDNTKKEEKLEVKGKLRSGENLILNEFENELKADIVLNNYNPQNPILDSMRTALFDLKNENNNPFFDNLSLFNRDFNKKLKSQDIELTKDRSKYTFKYILQKNKKSPLVLLFPSVGEGINNNHSAILAKLFYDEGYSVIIYGSHFQWEFLKSIDKNHKLGAIRDDITYVNLLINKSINFLSQKYDRVFLNRVALGTSLGAYTVLFLANSQFEDGANNIDKFIAICPPVELTYAINQMDKIISAWKNYPNNFQDKIALTAAKVMMAYKDKNNYKKDFNSLPFSNYEAKLISAFIFHQKLSDLILASEIENKNQDKKDIYAKIYNTNFKDYIKNNLLNKYSYEELCTLSSLNSISNYLISKNNYRIYHSLDDYLTNKEQLKDLKAYAKDKLTLFDHGAHLGFLYRDEFIESLKKEISLK